MISARDSVRAAPYKPVCKLGRDTCYKSRILSVYHAEIDFVLLSEFPKALAKMIHPTRAGHVANYKNFHKNIFLFGSIPRRQFYVFYKVLFTFIDAFNLSISIQLKIRKFIFGFFKGLHACKAPFVLDILC
jgi:hypothetical protein